MVKLLLDRGADPNVKESVNGFTPFFMACYHNYVELVKLLLDRGADLHTKDKNGSTPRLFACHRAIQEGACKHPLISEENRLDKIAIERIIDRWPAMMWILCLKELLLYHWLDMSLIDLFEFIGQETDFD